jgi:IclR family pca regulon transcriptional regulator
MTESGERPTRREDRVAGERRSSPVEEGPSGRLSSSLQRGVGLLLEFSEERQLLGISELAELTGLSRPTTHRYASTLVQLGYLEQEGPARKYRLATGAGGPGAEIVGEIRRALPVREVLEDLRDAIGHTVSMGLLDGTRVLYIHRLFGHRRGQHAIDRELRVGAHIPAYCTALGRAMLASLSVAERRDRVAAIDLVPHGPRSIVEQHRLLVELDEVDSQAPVLSDEELVIGARSIAMLLPQTGRMQPLAIDVTVPSEAYTAAQLLKQIGPQLRLAARLTSP